MVIVLGRMSRPAFLAAAALSIRPKMTQAAAACALIAASRFSIVSSTECLLGLVTSPSSADAATEDIASAIAATIRILVILRLFSHAAGSEKNLAINGVLPPSKTRRNVRQPLRGNLNSPAFQ